MDTFWSKRELVKILNKKKLEKPKLITAIGMFYDLEDPNKFIKDAADSLDDDGIFVAQFMSLKSMIEKMILEIFVTNILNFIHFNLLNIYLKKMV